jgi:hypothetical protein
MSSSWRRMSAVRMPLRRWVGKTPTRVTPAMPAIPPGTVIRSEKTPVVPTIAVPSKAARLRSSSVTLRSDSSSSPVGCPPNACSVAVM